MAAGSVSLPLPLLSAVDIQTPRLLLKPMSADFLRASAGGAGAELLSPLIGARVAPDWCAERDLAALRLADLSADPDYGPWSVRALVLRDSGEMVGHAGFHTRPGPDYLAPYARDGWKSDMRSIRPTAVRGTPVKRCRPCCAGPTSSTACRASSPR